MTAPRFLLVEMGEYEKCLADVRREHRRLREAPTDAERERARVDHDRALARAREIGARLTRELAVQP